MKLSSLALVSTIAPCVVFAVWRLDARVLVPALGAIGYVCASGSIPNCAIAAVASLILTAISGINQGTPDGTNGSPVRRAEGHSIKHYHTDGSVFDFLNTTALESGVWHRVVTNGVELLASKHADGHNMLKATLQPSEGISKRADDPNAISEVTAQWGNRNWPVSNQWSQDELNNMASQLLNTDNLDAQEYCSTISDDTDDDHFDLSWTFDTTNHYHTEFPPPCGA
ncbi:hypothetical protein KCU65_g2645, partial [Aureobasidium melanogenum]